jgi:hypothetical protein
VPSANYGATLILDKCDIHCIENLLAGSTMGSAGEDTKGRESGRHLLKLSHRKVGVGIMITHDPLHRSGPAELPHPAPTLGEDAQAHERMRIRIRMTNPSRWKPSRNVAPRAASRQVVTLAATAQHRTCAGLFPRGNELPVADVIFQRGNAEWAKLTRFTHYARIRELDRTT